MVSISAALIVRNEVHFLPGCLSSLNGQVDEVVIVDTGSDDGTVEIAQRAGARVLHFAWDHDFAAARNHGLESCRGDWILYIDADERLAVDGGCRLADLIDGQRWIGATVRFRPKTGYTRYLEPRLHRSDPRLRFAGRIHETVHPSMLAVGECEGLAIGQTPAMIDHLGYDNDQSRKHERNLPLLEQSVQASPHRVYYWYHLAETLNALGRRAEALAAAASGIRAAKADPTGKHLSDASLLYQLTARLELDSGGDPADLIAEGLKAMPHDHALQFLEARRLVMKGEPAAALPIIDKLLSINPDTLAEGLLAFDQNIFGRYSHEIKAAALLKLGRAAEAALALSAAMHIRR